MVTGETTQRRTILVVGALVALAAIVAGIVLVSDDDGDDDPATTTSTAAASSTSGPSTTAGGATSTSVGFTAADLELAAFPDLRSGESYGDLQTLAQAFATQVLGFDTDVVVDEFRQGDARSGEVPIRPAGAGSETPTTAVLVRQVSNGSWVVIGASTPTIRLDTPDVLDTLTSPQELAGAASAFEGHVDVALYADGTAAPIATTFVTGRGDGVLGEFTGELAFEAPAGVRHGLLVLSAPSAEDGTTWAATAVRVRL